MNDEYKQVSYSLECAFRSGVSEIPYKQMETLGFKIVASVPQSFYGSIWFTVENLVENMPEYISEMRYNFDYWHNHCYKNCEHFRRNPSCCYGGERCIND